MPENKIGKVILMKILPNYSDSNNNPMSRKYSGSNKYSAASQYLDSNNG